MASNYINRIDLTQSDNIMSLSQLSKRSIKSDSLKLRRKYFYYVLDANTAHPDWCPSERNHNGLAFMEKQYGPHFD